MKLVQVFEKKKFSSCINTANSIFLEEEHFRFRTRDGRTRAEKLLVSNKIRFVKEFGSLGSLGGIVKKPRKFSIDSSY